MIIERHYINGTEVNPPRNWQELSIELNYGKDQFPQSGVINITDFDWVRENYDLMMKYIDGGLTGDVGIFEGLPYRIDISKGSVTKTIFTGFIDLTNGLIVKDKIRLNAKAQNHGTVDWLNDVASGFTFEYLASLPKGASGAIDSDLYKYMPYILSETPNYQQAAISTLLIYNISQTIIKEINEIANLVAEVAGYTTTIPAIIKLILKILYLAVLILVLIKLIQDMIKFIISPVKYHGAMLVRDLMRKGVEYISNGKMTFVSDIWQVNSPYYNECIMPQKYYNPVNASDNSIVGFLKPDKNEQTGFFKGTFADLLEAMKIKFNAKIIVHANPDGSGTVSLVRKDKNASPPVYQLKDIYQPEFSYNTDELISNYEIMYQTDSSEKNTLQYYQGTIFQVITQPVVFNYRPFVMMKNLTQITIPFARAVAKSSLTFPEKIIFDFLKVFEKIANVLIKVVNAVIKVVNEVIKIVKKIFKILGIKLNIPTIPLLKPANFSDGIKNRTGMMLLSADNFSVAKIFIITEGSEPKYNKISKDNPTYEDAKAHWNLFHYVNSFLPKQLNPIYTDRPTGNQYIKKSFSSVPFDWNDYLAVENNNRVYSADGSDAIIESLKFNPSKQVADMVVRFGKIYTLNLVETFLYPDGQ